MSELAIRPVVFSSPIQAEPIGRPTGPATASPASTTKRYLFYCAVFSSLVLLNCALIPVTGALFYYSNLPSPHMWLIFLLVGANFGQWILLCLWMSFGRFREPWRQLVCSLLVFGGAMYLGRWMAEVEFSLPMALMFTSIFWLMYASLITLRMLTFITLEFQNLQTSIARWPRRFSIASLMSFTVTLAIPCALLQWTGTIHPDLITNSLTLLIVGAVLLLILSPMALALLMPKRMLRWTLLALIPWILACALVFLARRAVGLETTFVLLGSGVIVVLNVGILRCCGARWLPTFAASDDSAALKNLSPSLN
jgi:hypothetical protein